MNKACRIVSKKLTVRLDVGIGGAGIEFVTIPNQASFGIGLQYQTYCLDVMELLVGIQ